MANEPENIGLCKKCGNCDCLNEEELCTRCSKHMPELKCCGKELEVISNKLLSFCSEWRIIVADCIICGNHYIIRFKDSNPPTPSRKTSKTL